MISGNWTPHLNAHKACVEPTITFHVVTNLLNTYLQRCSNLLCMSKFWNAFFLSYIFQWYKWIYFPKNFQLYIHQIRHNLQTFQSSLRFKKKSNCVHKFNLLLFFSIMFNWNKRKIDHVQIFHDSFMCSKSFDFYFLLLWKIQIKFEWKRCVHDVI